MSLGSGKIALRHTGIDGHFMTDFRPAADGTFSMAKRLVPEILDDCPVQTIRASFRKSWRYMDAYRYINHTFNSQFINRKGLNAKQTEFAVKKYKSHRRCGPMTMMSVELLLN